MSGTKTRHNGDRRFGLDGVFVEAIDLGPRHANVHVLFAGAGLFDLDREFHPGPFGRGFLSLDLGFLVRLGRLVCLRHRCILVVRAQ